MIAPDLHTAAVELHDAGIRVIPVRADGTKAPALRAWQDHQTTTEDLAAWFAGPTPAHTALGVVTGPVSGNLEMLEVEGPYMHLVAQVGQLLTDSDRADLWARIKGGWVETSPSGGVHYFYRVTGQDVPGNTKLASDEATTAEGHRTRPTIAETRGRGGQVVAAPTPGHAHPTNRPWIRITDGPHRVPTITAEEREDLHAAFRTLDRTRAHHVEPAHLAAYTQPTTAEDGTPPGADLEKIPWDQILTPAEWQIHHVTGRTTYWTRPGKTTAHGFSATTGHAEDRDRLYVFTTSTDFDPEIPYTKFGAYTVLHHDGNHSAAAAALRAGKHYGQKFGSQPTVKAPPPPEDIYRLAGQGPRAHPTATGTDGPAPTEAQQPLATVTVLPTAGQSRDPLKISDDGNALALVERYGDRLRYCPDRGRWLYWTGHRWEWQPKNGGIARELAKEIGRAMPSDNEWATHKRRTLSAKGTSDMLTQAATDGRIAVAFDDLDAHPWELNTPAGILDLTTGTLAPADPARLHTRTTRHAPDPEANPTRWHTFLTDTFGDPELIDYMHRLIGYSTIGQVREHILPFAHGGGGNGKGTFLEAITATLGDYATTSPNGFLMAAPYQQHSTEIARLAGARMVLCSEVNQTDRFDEAKVKLLTGGDTLTARFMRQDDFTFTPTHHLWLMGNDKPGVQAGGNSFWRRLRLIPFTRAFDGPEATDADRARRIEGLQGILADDENGPALMSWIAAGAAAYHDRGLTAPAGVEAATRTYSEEVDTVGRFLEDRTLTGAPYAGQREKVADVRAAYEEWCSEAGERPLAGRAFTTALTRHGIETGREVPKGPRGARMVRGLLLAGQDEPETLTGWTWATT